MTTILVNTQRTVNAHFLTQDGKPVDVTDWHKGQEGAWVYYERWNGSKCEAHGYVDSVSRKLLQTG